MTVCHVGWDTMNSTRVAIAAIAVLTLVVAGVTAPAIAAGANEDVTESSGDAGTAGPPADLPGPVPGFVEELLASIRAFIGTVGTGG